VGGTRRGGGAGRVRAAPTQTLGTAGHHARRATLAGITGSASGGLSIALGVAAAGFILNRIQHHKNKHWKYTIEYIRMKEVKKQGGLNAEIQSRIGHQLRAMYDDVVRQGVPDRFAELIRKLDAPEPDTQMGSTGDPAIKNSGRD